jgi:hypothetical protein
LGKARSVLALSIATLAVIALAGCTQPATPKPVGSASSTAAPSASASPSAALTPTFVPSGTAEQNKSFFDLTNNTLFTANGSANGQQIIDNLVTSGFDKASMQVTPDKSSINGAVDSILFSVKIGSACLLGQHGINGYSSSVGAALQSGVCLIGKTRPINW